MINIARKVTKKEKVDATAKKPKASTSGTGKTREPAAPAKQPKGGVSTRSKSGGTEKPEAKAKKGGPTPLEVALQIANKANGKLGAHTVVTGADALRLAQAERIPTGVLALDCILGGGLPRGKIIEIQGEESSGKSTVAIKFGGQIQQFALAEGKPIVYIPVEKALDERWCRALGFDLSQALIVNAPTAEQSLDVAESYIRANVAAAVIIDSVAALEPSDEFEKTMGETTVGLQARLISKFMRKTNTSLRMGVVDDDGHLIGQNNTIVLLINQQRDKIGAFTRPGMPPPKVTPGGRSIPFYADLRLEFKRTEYIKVSDSKVGQITKFNVIKSKSSKTQETGTFDLYYCRCEVDGIRHRKAEIDNTSALIELALKWDLVVRHGNKYDIEYPDGEVVTVVSRKEVEATIRHDAELQEFMSKRLLEMAAADDDEEDDDLDEDEEG